MQNYYIKSFERAVVRYASGNSITVVAMSIKQQWLAVIKSQVTSGDKFLKLKEFENVASAMSSCWVRHFAHEHT